MKRFSTFFLLIVFSSFFTFSACKQTAADEGVSYPNAVIGEKQMPPINVKVEPVGLSNLTEKLTLSGETTAVTDVTFSAETPGRVEDLSADLGMLVKKGQVLARIDYQLLKAQKDQAQANFELAQKTFNRLSQLKNDELISQQVLDEAQSQFLQSEASLQIANANLSKAIIRSTISGVVARKFVEMGEYVSPGQAVFQVVDFSTIVITAQVPETQVSKVSRGQPVTVNVPALNDIFEGKVHVVLPAAHPQSRTFQMRIHVPNHQFRILVGMAVTLKIDIAEHNNVIVVNQDTVVEEDNAKSVFIIERDRAAKRQVTLGPVDGHQVVLEKGIKPGEQLVILGQRELVDGQPVRIISQ